METLEPRQLLSAAVSNTEILTQVGSKNGLVLVTHWVRKHPDAFLSKSISLKHSKQLFNTSKHATLQIRLQPGVSVKSAIKAMSKMAGARWAAPNVYYGKAKTELTPNDPRLNNQSAALNVIQAPQAWDTTTGTGVIVAVLDDGVDITHEDLAANIWTNPGEIPGNGIDDDGNGFIDDINGWDFGNNDNNPAPVFDQQYSFINSHGTLVAGIIAAKINNGVGIAGVAGNAKIMPVRFTGYGVNVTSAGIAQSLAYAATNGAKIINVSFSIDPYMNDAAFRAATDLVHATGALWINSAGNSPVANPPRLTIDKAIFVSNTANNDIRYSNSNWGDGIDISSPGVDIHGTAPGDKYQGGTGTSFSAAMTSGTAALIWSANPTWTRDQVAAQLLGSVDSIDAQNPTLVGQLGTGRINAYKAVTTNIAPPTVRDLKGIANNAVVTTLPTTLTLSLKSVLNGSTVNASAFKLIYAGANGIFDETDASIPLTLTTSYAYGTNGLTFALPANLSGGLYRFVASATIADPFGQALDGNADGTGGDDFVSTFSIELQPPAAPTGLTVANPSYTTSEGVLRWTDASSDETSFLIERSSTPTFEVINRTMTSGANTTTYYDWGLRQGQVYYYRIKAINPIGASAASNVAMLDVPLPPPGIPATPASFIANTPSYSLTEVELVWTDSSDNETGFVIERSTTLDFAAIDKTLTAVPGSNRYNDWGLTVGQTYFYRLKAVNGDDSSAWVTLSYAPPAPTTAPTAPTDLIVAPVAWSTTELQLNWSDNSNNETFFTVERSLTNTFAAVTTLTANPYGQFNDWGLANDTTYFYRVRAGNVVGSSAWSNVFSVKTLPVT